MRTVITVRFFDWYCMYIRCCHFRCTVGATPPPPPPPILFLGVAMELRLVVDLVSTIFDIPSAAAAMKDDVWTRYM